MKTTLAVMALLSLSTNSFAMDMREKLALMINMNGHLCAKVDEVSQVDGGRFAVTCTEYRDGSGTARYIYDVANGTAVPG